MIFTLTRDSFTPDGIFGTLVDSNNKLSLSTLEHSYDNKPKLYDGTFNCVKGIHRLHDNIPFEAYEVTGVQGHTGILLHVGNYNADSDGCVLVGIDRDGNMIRHSMIAFSKLMGFLNGEQTFTLIVKSV
jgi:Family of unknown function (DUF5675)